MKATFSSWILSSGLNCAHELRVSSLKHQDCCSYHLQTWFVEGNVVQQLGIYFLFFWLAIWGGRKKETFAEKVEQQRWTSYGRIFAKIVAIRNPPLFYKNIGGNIAAEIPLQSSVVAVILPRKTCKRCQFSKKRP